VCEVAEIFRSGPSAARAGHARPVDLTSRAQWLGAGFSDDELRPHERRGSYVQGGLPDDVLARHILQVRAAVGELASDAVVSHVSAAVLHGLQIWGVRLDRVHVTRRRSTGGRCGALVHVHSAALDPIEVVVIAGVPVTSLARTVADLGRMLPFEQAVVFADSAMFHRRPGRIDKEDVLAVLDHEPRRPGTRAARRMLEFSTALSESVGESRSRVAIAAAGLPPPVLQWEVNAAETGAFIGRVDMGWPTQRTVGEFDGLVKYGRTLRPGQDVAAVLVEEKLREDALRDEDLAVVRWIWEDLTDFRPTARRIRSRFRAA
jgi:hypothetical protein